MNMRKVPNNDAFQRSNYIDEIGVEVWGSAINA